MKSEIWTESGQRIKTSVGRIIFNEALPKEIGFVNKVVDKSGLKQIVADCYKVLTNEGTRMCWIVSRSLGFHYATTSGITIAANDIEVPASKPELIKEAEDKALVIENQFHQGLITEDERYNGVVEVWTKSPIG